MNQYTVSKMTKNDFLTPPLGLLRWVCQCAPRVRRPAPPFGGGTDVRTMAIEWILVGLVQRRVTSLSYASLMGILVNKDDYRLVVTTRNTGEKVS
jgi:hypothetical protein